MVSVRTGTGRGWRFFRRNTPPALRWFFANIVAPVIPFGLIYLDSLRGDPPPRYYVYFLWEHGELAVIAGVLSAVALADFVGPKQRWETLGILAFWASLGCTIGSFYLFGLLHAGGYSPFWINALSLVAFGASVFASAVCKIATRISDVEKDAAKTGDAP